jgi:hypothetical protein
MKRNPGPRSTIETHPRRDAIEALLEAGVPGTLIASHFALSPAGVKRYRLRFLGRKRRHAPALIHERRREAQQQVISLEPTASTVTSPTTVIQASLAAPGGAAVKHPGTFRRATPEHPEHGGTPE